MKSNYPAIEITRRNGDEQFLLDKNPIGFDLLGFWKWFGSDLTGNTARGILAEYIVAKALGLADGVRVEWEPFDLKLGDIQIEVKSSSYIQTWHQKSVSKISFGIQRTKIWNAHTGTFDGELRRQAHLYVFCVLAHKETKTLNPMELDQWNFYVLPTSILNEKCETQKTIGLARLIDIGAISAKYVELADRIHELQS